MISCSIISIYLAIHIVYFVIMLVQIYDNSKQFSCHLVQKEQMAYLLETEGTNWHVDELPNDHEIVWLEDYFEEAEDANELNSIFFFSLKKLKIEEKIVFQNMKYDGNQTINFGGYGVDSKGRKYEILFGKITKDDTISFKKCYSKWYLGREYQKQLKQVMVDLESPEFYTIQGMMFNIESSLFLIVINNHTQEASNYRLISECLEEGCQDNTNFGNIFLP